MTDGLVIPVGLTERQYLAALKRIEASTVRAANANAAAFRKANPQIERSFQQVDAAASRAASYGLRNVALQLGQVAQQGAATGQYMQAMAIQLPDLLLGFGTFGAVAGVAAGALAPFIANLLGAESATERLVASLTSGEGSLSSVRSAIDELRQLQERYTAAIEASGAASAGAADAVVANTAREFSARRQLLEQEVRLLRLRGATMRLDAQTLREDIQRQGQQAAGATTGGAAFPGVSTGAEGDRGQLAGLGQYVNVRPRNMSEVAGMAEFARDTERANIALQTLDAQITQVELAAEEGAAALSEFTDPGGGSSGAASAAGSGGGAGGGSGGGRAGRGSGRARQVAGIRSEIEATVPVIQQVDLAALGMEQRFTQAFASIVTGASSAQEALAGVLNAFAGILAQQAASGLYGAASSAIGGLFGGGFNPAANPAPTPGLGLQYARGAAFRGGRVTAFARGGVVDGPTLFPMASGMGLMGEAGPEAVMPLRRGAGGRLGVAASGAEIIVRTDPGVIVEVARGEAVRVLRRETPGIVQQSVGASGRAMRATKGFGRQR